MREKPIIAVDIDNVLAKTAETFAEYSNRTWATAITPSDFGEDFTRVWGVSYEVALLRLNQIYSAGVFADIPAMEAALAVLQHLRRQYRLVIVTSRRKSIAGLTREWVNTSFPGCFEDIYFSGIYDGDLNDLSLLRMTKGEVLQNIGAAYLIDDEPKHCFAADSVGVKSLLFQMRASGIDQLPATITPVGGWEEVKRYFDEQ
jgi:hypothetical protein